MKVFQKSTDVLIVKTETILSIVLGAGGLFFLCLAFYSFVVHSGTIQDRIYWGQAGAAVTLLLMAAVLFEQSVFVFDRGQRLLTWKRRTALKKLSGSIDFDSIKSIKVQSMRDSDNYKSVRVVIYALAEEVPLTKSYTGSNAVEETKLAEKLNQWVRDENNSLTDGKWIEDLELDSGDKESMLSITALKRIKDKRRIKDKG